MSEQVTVARKSYEHLLRTRDRALRDAEWQAEQVVSAERWAHEAFAEQRRLQDRLTAVVAAAASLGVSIDAINQALGTTRPPTPPTQEHSPEQAPDEREGAKS